VNEAVDEKRAIVAGAGIGGLAAGIALRRAGFEVTVLERSAAPREVGSGILVQPNGVRALESLGIRALPGNALQSLELRSGSGRHLSETPIGRFRERYGTELIVAPRSELHSLLMETLGRDRVTAGAEVTGYEVGSGKVTVKLRDGTSLEADLLIGADGLRSAVRAQLLGDGEPRYLGCTAWRATADLAGSGLQVGQGLNWWGPGAEFGVLPMGRTVYWFSTANVPRGGEDPPGAERIRALLDRFGGWEAPIAAIIASTPPEAILRNDIFDRPPARRWVDGPVALLGDAAHPMAPNAAQGACQALEDAAALGVALAEGPDIGSGLVAYERRRLSRANGFVRISRQISAAVQTESRLLAGVRDLAARLMPERLLLGQLDRTLGGS
jgi:2-polyprenyl-6-methoxyphenol hydroxylase-like FAD-dependent oxidoreductase